VWKGLVIEEHLRRSKFDHVASVDDAPDSCNVVGSVSCAKTVMEAAPIKLESLRLHLALEGEDETTWSRNRL